MLICRQANLSDADRLTDFNCQLARETEGKELPSEIVRSGVLRGLALTPEVHYFVAESDGVVVGQIMLTREWSDWRDGWMLWLQSVYVQAEWRGRGVFRKLLGYALGAATLDGKIVSIRLYVEQDNLTAQECYRRVGFHNTNYRVMEMPFMSTETE